MAFDKIRGELPLPIPGVGLSDAPSATFTANAADAELVSSFEGDKEFLKKIAAKSKESFKAEEVDAMLDSINGDPIAIERLREAYEQNFDRDDKAKDNESDEEFKVAVKAQMLMAELSAAGNDKEKIQGIIRRLNDLKSSRGAGGVQSVIGAAQSQAGTALTAALAAVATIASSVVSAVSAAKDFFFGNYDHKQFTDSFKSLEDWDKTVVKSMDGSRHSNKAQKMEELEVNFKMLQDGKGELQLFKVDDGVSNISLNEQNKFMGAVNNLMSFKNTLASIEGKDTTEANNAIVKEVRLKMGSIIKLQEQMVKDQATGIEITNERIKELNDAKVQLKTFIQEKVLKAPAAMSVGKSAAVATSGLAKGTETTVVPELNNAHSLPR